MKQKMSEVNAFLENKRLAIVGMSRDEKQLSRHLLKAFGERGYDVVPVNPAADEIGGFPVSHTINEIDPPVDAALLMLSGEKVEQAANDALAAGVKNLWIYGVTGPREVDKELLSALKQKGANVIAGYCPFMFLEGVETGHKVHAWIWKAIGLMPKKG
ncbi:CoA-binding protein [bacterium]|nr:CoA-binding protein [bacterium]